tara:strand:+ start:3736 stop:3927 length:192 start_codon:yes stop_codon:yes gene_type:complete
MTLRKKSKIPYIRRQQHIKYVEQCAVEQRSKIINTALMFGMVNNIDRELFLKYNDYLTKLKQK